MKKLYYFVLTAIFSLCCVMSASAEAYQSVEPANGSIVSSLRAVSLTFAGNVADFGSKYQNVTVTGDNYNASCVLEYGNAENQINITFSEITVNGEYTINVPEDAITVDGTAVAAFTLNYTVGEDIDGKATLLPAPGEVEWLYEVVYYNSAINKTLSTNYSATPATITSSTGVVQELNPVYDWQIGEGKYRLNVRKLINEPGEYTVNIPDDLLYYYNDNYEKVAVPGCQFTYTVKGGTLTTIDAIPSVENPVTLFNQFKISFPGYDTIEKNSTASINIWQEGVEQTKASFSFDYSITVEGNSINYLNQYSSIIDPGHYYMTFPAGCVLLGDDKTPCTPFLYEFDIVEPAPMVVEFTPGDGANVTMLNHVIVKFPEIESVTMNSNASVALYRVCDDGSTLGNGSAYGSNGITRINDNTFDVHFNNLATVDGEYMIVLQKNSFSYAEGFNQEESITVNFTNPELAQITIDPANGASLDKIQDFTITFPGVDVVKLNNYLSNKTVTLYAGSELIDNGWGGYSNSQIGSTSNFVEVEGAENTFSFKLSSAAINQGDYTLVIPAGIFLIGEDEHSYSAAAQFNYTATGEGVDKIAVNPNTKVASLQNVSITYVNETSISLQNEYVGFPLYKEVPDQSWGTYLEFVSASTGAVSVDGNVLNINFGTEYTEAGTYYIEITAWSLYMSDGVTPSTPQRVTFEVDPLTSITDVNVESNFDGRIFTIQGIEVKDMTRPGIYITNGKKVIIK